MMKARNKSSLKFVRLLAVTMCFLLLGSFISSVDVNAAPKEETTPSNLLLSELESKVDAYVENYINTTIPGVAIVVVKDGNIVLSKGYGFSNLETKTVTTTTETVYEYAGLTEAYTWTAVMQLVEEDKLDLEKDIFTYLPEKFSSKLKKKLVSDEPITMVHLMNNTAGFEENEFDVSFYNASFLSSGLEEALVKTMPKQVYAPGEVMTGSSYSASLAGYLVECVTGIPFYEYVSENILAPLGTPNVSVKPNFANNALIVTNKAIPYASNESQFEEVSHTYFNLYPTSGMNGTAEEAAKLMMSFLQKGEEEGVLLSRTSLATMQTRSYAVNDAAKGQTYGFYEYPAEIKAYYLEGESIGYSSMMTFVPEEQFGVVIMTNTGNGKEFLYGLTDYLLVEDREKNVVSAGELPSIDPMMETNYIGAQRTYSNMLEIFGYFMNCPRFEKVDDMTISINGEPYRQVEPYVFQYVGDSESPIYQSVASKIYFGHTEDGQITKWSYGSASATEYVDINMAEKNQGFVSLTFLAVIVTVLAAAFLFTHQFASFILDMMQKRISFTNLKGAFRYFAIIFIALVINLLSLLMKMMSKTNLASSSFKWNVYANIVLAVLGIASLVYMAVKAKGQVFKPYKIVLASFMIMCFVTLLYFMFTWNFFVLL